MNKRSPHRIRSSLCLIVTATITGLSIFGVSMPVSAANEFVTVVKVLSNDDHGILVRSNGDAYQIEKGLGCVSFWRYEGKQVLVSSTGSFLGVGSELILVDEDQKCRIWDSKEIGQLGVSSTEQPSNTPKRASQKPYSRNCIDGHWISSVSGNGQIVVLEDRSIWQINAVEAIESMLWLPTENVLICGSRLINSHNGKAVSAKRLK